MDKSFDPYYKWLGIPPRDQPPHHYRLLGIEVFESDRDVIDAAANRVMSYLKDLAVADEAQYSQKLLNEVSRARLCLLNRQKKAAYDAELKAQLAERSGADPTPPPESGPDAAVTPPPEQPAAPPAVPPILPSETPPPVTIKVSETPHRVVRHGKKAKRERPVTMLIGLSRRALMLSGALVGLGVLALLFLMLQLSAPGPTVEPRVPAPSDQTSGLSQPPDWPPGVNRQWQDQQTRPAGSGPGLEPTDLADLPEPSGELPGPGDLSPDREPATTPEEQVEPDETEERPAVGPDDRPPSGLPDRADFVDPITDGDTEEEVEEPPHSPRDRPTTEPPPAEVPSGLPDDSEPGDDSDVEVGPEADPEEGPSESTIDFPFPFADLPASVDLPVLDQAQTPAAMSLGPVHLREPVECSIQLVGGERVSRRSYQFTLDSIEGEARWDFFVHRGDTETRIAQLAIDEDHHLSFVWESAAAEFESAPLLANCALQLSGPPDAQHLMALRQRRSEEPLAIDWDQGSTRAEVALAHVPDPRRIVLEVVGIEGAEADLEPPPQMSADDGQLTLLLQGEEEPLALDLQFQGRRNLQLTVTPWLHFPDEKPNLRDQRPFTTKLKDRIEIVQRAVQRLEHELTILPRNLPTPRHQVEEEYRQRIERAKKAVDQLERLQTRVSDPDGELRLSLRVFFKAADGTPVELLHWGREALTDQEQASEEP